uniref:Serine/threonine-protein phosphatase PGAM5, mitochondrial n=1 Tax=Meloidogyne hapla TaxID=6305 RepID=A0A1I8BQM2_MELHA
MNFITTLLLSRLLFIALGAGGLDLSTAPTPDNWFEEGLKRKWDSNWDFRDPETIVEQQASGMSLQFMNNKPNAARNIFLVRHGIYFRKNKTVEEQKLTPIGREQAEFLGKWLTERKDDFNFDKCVFSTLLRARQTGEIIIKQMPHLKIECTLDSILEEGSPYPAEPFKSHWKPIDPLVYNSEGARMEAAFRKYIHRASPTQKEDSYELIVCHANLIRYFVCRVLQYPPEGWVRFTIAHTSITWLRIRKSGRLEIRSIGDFGHLPPDKNKTTFHNV